MRSKAVFCLVRQRTDQIDVLYFGDQLPHHCLGHDPGYPLAPASRSCEASKRITLVKEATSRNGWFRGRCPFVPCLDFSQHGSNFFLIRDSFFYQNVDLQPVISTEPSPHLYRFALPHPPDCPHTRVGEYFSFYINGRLSKYLATIQQTTTKQRNVTRMLRLNLAPLY